MRKAVFRFVFAATLLLTGFGVTDSAGAQTSASGYTTGYRYDSGGRTVGVISPDPDGGGASGPLKYAAVRTSYDVGGRAWKVETGELASWKSEGTAPADWGTAFVVLWRVERTFDGMGHKLTETVIGSDNVATSLTQYSYDDIGRLKCTAVRMNPAVYNSLISNSTDACSLGQGGSNGPDRITKNVYDAAGQLIQIRKALGTSLEQAYATYSYTANGKQQFVVDANGNKAKLEYDGFDRLSKWIFPSTTRPSPSSFNSSTPANALATSGAINNSDYEQYGYDANGNRTSLRKRDGSTLAFQYDALNRMTVKTVPSRAGLDSSHVRDVYYTYDLRGLPLAVRFDNATTGSGIVNTYTGFGQLASTTNTLLFGNPDLEYLYDLNGNRTRITHPDGQAFDMTFDGLNRLKEIKKGSAVLVAPTYNARGLVGGVARYNAAHSQSFDYDTTGRLDELGFNKVGSSSNVAWSFTRNPASQIRTETRDNDLYTWTGRVNVDRDYVTNGLNQYSSTQVGTSATAYCYDPNGNLTDDGQYVYLYDVENRLVEMRERNIGGCPSNNSGYGGSLLASLHYDPMGRLYEVVDGETGGITRFMNDGDALVLEYSGSNTILRRYVHGNDVGADDPLLWYEGPETTDAALRNLYADPRGSIVLVAGQDGASLAINTYDEWGIGDLYNNKGRFQYTGQAWLDELGMYYYKARIYSPKLGRFMQTDPIGYEDQVNLYAYVANDPVNAVDYSGAKAVAVGRVVLRVAIRGERIGRALEGIAKETVADWHELDADSDASFKQQLGSFIDIIVGTDLNHPSEIYDTDRTGKIKDTNPGDVHVGDDEVESAIGELDKSIERRRFENNRNPRGNPNGSSQEKRDNQIYKSHAERIRREEALRDLLRKRVKED